MENEVLLENENFASVFRRILEFIVGSIHKGLNCPTETLDLSSVLSSISPEILC